MFQTQKLVGALRWLRDRQVPSSSISERPSRPNAHSVRVDRRADPKALGCSSGRWFALAALRGGCFGRKAEDFEWKAPRVQPITFPFARGRVRRPYRASRPFGGEELWLASSKQFEAVTARSFAPAFQVEVGTSWRQEVSGSIRLG